MSQRRKTVVGIVAVLFVLFVVIQFIPVPARANPPVQSQIQWESPQTEQLVRAACYDCHSNETVWPWYAQIAPISWLVAHDVEEGRDAMNFSVSAADEISGEEAAEEVEEGAMPPKSYLPLHPAANLSADQKAALIAGLQASLTGSEEGERGEREGEESESGEAEENESEADEASESGG